MITDMTENEIVRSYQEAKNKKQQIGILADLNNTTSDRIKEIIENAGALVKPGRPKATVKGCHKDHTGHCEGCDEYDLCIDNKKEWYVTGPKTPEAPKEQPKQEKPPLGLMPRSVFESKCEQQRVIDILDAMERYSNADKVIPVDWVSELRERVFLMEE